ncbi:hypothetical protein QFC19_008343 [Naganishia cerealis]|uniref:Uncharacterized protein n=1 Tax=Naganishia cerealis TaxID=610337 RepID=A0ACC2V2R9_9TREE|nr:hypothetical protein QFC19_008343 [Naganishia cerealis]
MGVSLLTDSLRGHSPLTSIQIVLANVTRNPSFLPTAIIASQTLFFGVQAIAAWRQLRFMDAAAYWNPVDLELKPEDAKVQSQRIKQSLVVNVLERAAWCSVTVALALGGWNVLWGSSLSAGQWYEQRFRSRQGHLVANPVFSVLDYAASLTASLIVKNLYLAYNAPQIDPETTRLSFFARLKRRIAQSWNTHSRKIWFYKTIVPYVLPLLSLVPVIIAASRVQYRFERGMIVSFKKICREMFKVALVLGASIPSIFSEPEEPVNKDTPDLPSWAIEQCLISDLGERGIRLKGIDGEQSLDLIKVESLVAEVVGDTAYEGELKIALRFDTELRDKDERALAFVPNVDLVIATIRALHRSGNESLDR